MTDRQNVALSRDRNAVTPERWKQIETVLEQALELPTEKRPAFLNQTCDGDKELRAEIESLLQAHSSSGSLIDDRSHFYEAFDETDATLPLTIGPYRIVRELGRGGMGSGSIRCSIRCGMIHASRNSSAVLSQNKHPPPTALPEKSIAVLPFENLSHDKQNSYFAVGVRERFAISERSGVEGSPGSYLEAFATGSLDFARDDR